MTTDTTALRGPALFREILQRIIAEPRSWDQTAWHSAYDPEDAAGYGCPVYEERGGIYHEHTCGTAHCIAGWALVLRYPTREAFMSDNRNDFKAPSDIAYDLFELQESRTWIYNRLFHIDLTMRAITETAFKICLLDFNNPDDHALSARVIAAVESR